MAILALVLLPLIANLVVTIIPREMALNTVKPTPNTLTLESMPNPFPVPGTDITLEFLPPPGMFSPQPPRGDVIKIFELAKSDIEAYIRVLDDGPIMGNEYLLDYGKVEMIMNSLNVAGDPLKYSDLLAVILGMSLKMAREGCKNTSARVLRNGQLDTIGLAAVYRPGNMRDTSA